MGRRVMRVLRRLLPVLLTAGILIGGMAVAAKAQPPAQVSDNIAGGNNLCMNRDGGGTAQGTKVIAYNCNNANNFFQYRQYDTMCGSGYVTANYSNDTGCPFANFDLDVAYQGDGLGA